MEHPVLAVHEQAARDWCAWGDAAIAHETLGNPAQYNAKPTRAKLVFVRICTHCIARNARLEDEQILQNALRLKGIPRDLILGRRDLSGPSLTAWELASAARRPVQGHRGLCSHRQPGNGHRHPGCHRTFRP
jgi:proline iminopeptidase